MATFKSVNTVINFNNIDLNWYIQNFYAQYAEDNTYGSFNGVSYQDAYVVNGYDSPTDSYLIFGGSSFKYSNSNMTGTVTLIAETDSSFTYGWFLSGVSLKAASILAAAKTTSTTDDFALIKSALKGNDTLTLSSGDDVAYGFAGNDTIKGKDGVDKIYGGLGNDTLAGGDDTDFFFFDSVLGTNNIDTISDFYYDYFMLDNDVFKKFSGYDSFDKISSKNFIVGTKALDSNDYLVYNSSNRTLYYDADGSGNGKMVAFCKTSYTPAYDDFLIIG